MAVSINWPTGVIFVPRADMPVTQASPEIRGFDLEQFRLDLKTLEATPEGMPFPDTHTHNTKYTISGFEYVRAYSIIPPYTVEFEDGQYGVAPFGANANILDVKVANQVSYQSQNSGGLLTTGTSGLTGTESTALLNIETMVGLLQSAVAWFTKIFANKRLTDPVAGTLTVYDDDDVTPLASAPIYEDVAGVTPYRGQGVDRTDRLT